MGYKFIARRDAAGVQATTSECHYLCILCLYESYTWILLIA